MEHWGPERIDDIVAHLAVTMPAEDLTADEILTACYDRPGVVLAEPAGIVAVGVGRSMDGELVATVRLLSVSPEDPDATHRLLTDAEQWARDRDARRVELGGALPFFLWPGVEVGSPLLAAAATRGYLEVEGFEAHGVPNSFRAEPPVGIEIRRAVSDEHVTAVQLAAAARWPWWSDEIARALDHGTCHVALDPDETVIGVGCHSITRATWVGPLLVVDTHRRRGIGHALLGAICRDLMIADFPIAEVPRVDGEAMEAFVRAAGARSVRAYRRLVLELR